MNRTLRLFMVIGQAAFLLTGACVLLTLLSFAVFLSLDARSGPPPNAPSIGEAITMVAFFAVPAALAFWWIFRKLRAEYLRRQALGVAIAFTLFAPVPLIIGLALGPIVGGYTGIFFGTESRLVAFSGAVTGIVAAIALMTFVPSLLALWITRQVEGPDQAQ